MAEPQAVEQNTSWSCSLVSSDLKRGLASPAPGASGKCPPAPCLPQSWCLISICFFFPFLSHLLWLISSPIFFNGKEGYTCLALFPTPVGILAAEIKTREWENSIQQQHNWTTDTVFVRGLALEYNFLSLNLPWLKHIWICSKRQGLSSHFCY